MITSLGKGVATLETSLIGYGCMGLTAAYGDKVIPEKEAMAVLRKAYDLGVRHFDTAQVYMRKTEDGTVHHNEEVVGKFFNSLSAEEKKGVTVATKIIPIMEGGKLKFSEKIFRQRTQESIKRLGVDCIDLYYFHRIYPVAVSPVSEWMGAAKKLVDEGLIKRVGLSEASATIIREANKIHPITCIQQEWSLFARDLEKELVPTCKELGIGIVAYSPIGRGILAGSFTKKEDAPKDWRVNVPYLQKENLEKNLAVIEEIKAIAKEKKCTTGQLCLAWLINQGAVPIPGTTKVHHLEDNMGAVGIKLTDAEIKKLGELGNKVTGARGNEAYMKSTFHSL